MRPRENCKNDLLVPPKPTLHGIDALALIIHPGTQRVNEFDYARAPFLLRGIAARNYGSRASPSGLAMTTV